MMQQQARELATGVAADAGYGGMGRHCSGVRGGVTGGMNER
jgi:hypothetical protein